MYGRAEPGSIAKRVHDDAVHFDVHWSPLSLVDRYEIAASVPAVAGVYELYAELASRLHKFAVEGAWYGGLRAAIRAGTDGDVATDPERRALLAHWRCRYRFCAVDTRDDLFDLFIDLDTVSFKIAENAQNDFALCRCHSRHLHSVVCSMLLEQCADIHV